MNRPANISSNDQSILRVDPLAAHPARQQQQPGNDDRYLRRRLSGEEQGDDQHGGRKRAPHQDAMIPSGCRGGRQIRTPGEFAAVEEPDQDDRQRQPE